MTLRNKLLSAIAPLAIILSGCAHAETTAATSAPAAASAITAFDRNDADPALWVVKDDDTTIYLFGTIHLLKPDLLWFDDAVADAFEASDELVLEMVEPDPATMQQFVLARAMATDGIALRDRLNAEQRAKYDAAMTSFGVPPTAFDRFKPWMAAVTLSLLPAQKLGFDPAKGVEKIVTDRAKGKSVKIDAVETFEQQMGFFDALPVDDQIEYLMAGIDALPEYQVTMERMERTWATGDIEGLAALMTENLSETKALEKILLTDRNARWAIWLDERMERPGTVFMAVGAGHLAGKDSVQAFLAQRGLVAKRIVY